jgi:hypothetical protein
MNIPCGEKKREEKDIWEKEGERMCEWEIISEENRARGWALTV